MSGMKSDLAEAVRLILGIIANDHSDKLRIINAMSACSLFIRTHHEQIARDAEDAARYRWLRRDY